MLRLEVDRCYMYKVYEDFWLLFAWPMDRGGVPRLATPRLGGLPLHVHMPYVHTLWWHLCTCRHIHSDDSHGTLGFDNVERINATRFMHHFPQYLTIRHIVTTKEWSPQLPSLLPKPQEFPHPGINIPTLLRLRCLDLRLLHRTPVRTLSLRLLTGQLNL